MKIITVNEMRNVEVTHYAAPDGTEFESSYECLEYERNSRRREAWNTVRNIEVCGGAEGLYPPGMTGVRHPSGCTWYRPASAAETEALNAYYSFDGNIPGSYAGSWICVVPQGECTFGDHSACWSDLDSAVSYICGFLDAFDADLSDLASLSEF